MCRKLSRRVTSILKFPKKDVSHKSIGECFVPSLLLESQELNEMKECIKVQVDINHKDG